MAEKTPTRISAPGRSSCRATAPAWRRRARPGVKVRHIHDVRDERAAERLAPMRTPCWACMRCPLLMAGTDPLTSTRPGAPASGNRAAAPGGGACSGRPRNPQEKFERGVLVGLFAKAGVVVPTGQFRAGLGTSGITRKGSSCEAKIRGWYPAPPPGGFPAQLGLALGEVGAAHNTQFDMDERTRLTVLAGRARIWASTAMMRPSSAEDPLPVEVDELELRHVADGRVRGGLFRACSTSVVAAAMAGRARPRRRERALRWPRTPRPPRRGRRLAGGLPRPAAGARGAPSGRPPSPGSPAPGAGLGRAAGPRRQRQPGERRRP